MIYQKPMKKDSPSRIVLASGSPRRRELLKTLSIPFEVIISGVSEDLDFHLDTADMVKLLAQNKATAVAQEVRSGLVIGSDTSIDFEGTNLGKPASEQDAREMLRLLRNRRHKVISAIAVIEARDRRCEMGAVTTLVKMRNYSDEEIDRYVSTGEPMDKAGSYAIQGEGQVLVESIEGCYNNVVGFPLCELTALLERFGIVPNVQGPACKLPSGGPCPRLR